MSIDNLLRQNRDWAAEQVERDPAFFTRQLGGHQDAPPQRSQRAITPVPLQAEARR